MVFRSIIAVGLFLVFWQGFRLGEAGSRALRDPKRAGDFGQIEGWMLSANAGEAQPPVRLSFDPAQPDLIKVWTGRAYPRRWDVQLSRRGFSIQAGKRYLATARIRGDQPLRLEFLLNESQPPWSRRGLYVDLAIGTEWTIVSADFVANATDPNATLMFDFGGNPGPAHFEIADVQLQPHDSSTADRGLP